VTLTEKGPGKRGQGRNVVGLEEPDYQRDSEEAVCEWGSYATPPHSKQSATERGAELLASIASPSNEGTLTISRRENDQGAALVVGVGPPPGDRAPTTQAC